MAADNGKARIRRRDVRGHVRADVRKNDWRMGASIKTAAIGIVLLLAAVCAMGPAGAAQLSLQQSQTSSGQAGSGQGAQASGQTTQSPQESGLPDAPAVQPSAAAPEPPPLPKPEAKKPVQRDPWTNQPINQTGPEQPAAEQPATGASSGEAASPPPPMPPVKTIPPGTSTKMPSGQEELTIKITTNFVQVPVVVKDHNGHMVDGLLSTDFVVKENGIKQKLTFFTADPFALSVAIVLDLGMSDSAVQQVNQTFPALVGAFAPYDEVALYTYSSTVSQVTDFAAPTQKLSALLNQMKTVRGQNNGPPVLAGPLAPNGPIINGKPVDSPTEPVYTPSKQAHVLNDAILQAALDLRKRKRTQRKIIFVISNGRESGSTASFKDVKRVLLSNEIQVVAVQVGSAALPVYGRLERFHIPDQAVGDILPKYTSAPGTGMPYSELSRSAIEDVYARAKSEARNQYTLGYTPTKPKTPTANPYRSIEVLVEHPGLKVYAKDGYYPAQTPR